MKTHNNYKEILCPMCVAVAKSGEFQEVFLCAFPDDHCLDCPIDWEKLRIG